MSENQELKFTAGKPLAEGTVIGSKDDAIEAIKMVQDPEMMLNVYDLGLIYSLDIDNAGNVKIDMTLTAPNCPVAGEMPQRVAEAVASRNCFGLVTVRLVWEPEWTVERLTEEARMMIEIF